MKRHVALTLGFFVAPLFAAVALMVLEMMRKDYLELIDILGWAPIFYCYTLGVSLIIGLLVYLPLKYFNKVTWWSAILGGMFGSTITVIIFNALNPLVIVVGGLSGLVFWLIWRLGEHHK